MGAPAFGADGAQSISVGGFMVATMFYGVPGLAIALAYAGRPNWGLLATVTPR